MAGQGVIEDWADVLRGGKLDRKFYEPALFHTKVDRELMPAPDLRLKLKTEARPRARAGFEGPEWKANPLEMDYSFETAKEPGKQAERYIFLASHVPTVFASAFETGFLFVPKGAKKGEKRTVYGCPIGVQLVDEFTRSGRKRARW